MGHIETHVPYSNINHCGLSSSMEHPLISGPGLFQQLPNWSSASSFSLLHQPTDADRFGFLQPSSESMCHLPAETASAN